MLDWLMSETKNLGGILHFGALAVTLFVVYIGLDKVSTEHSVSRDKCKECLNKIQNAAIILFAQPPIQLTPKAFVQQIFSIANNNNTDTHQGSKLLCIIIYSYETAIKMYKLSAINEFESAQNAELVIKRMNQFSGPFFGLNRIDICAIGINCVFFLTMCIVETVGYHPPNGVTLFAYGLNCYSLYRIFVMATASHDLSDDHKTIEAACEFRKILNNGLAEKVVRTIDNPTDLSPAASAPGGTIRPRSRR
jgi:hypothetical protein